jgi:flagellar basal-body rod modification protein FlgD
MSSPVTSSVSSLPALTDPGAVTAKNTLDKDSFLKLLTAQLQHQDPTAPMDSNAFVAQLAQFSSVEALENMGGKLDAMALSQANANRLAVPQVIGKQVLYKSGQVALTRGQPADFSVTLADDAAAVTATIQDASGRTVRTLSLGARSAGAGAATWNGQDDQGRAAEAGTYFLTVSATGKGGGPVGASTSVRGVVSGVSFEGTVPNLLVNGTAISLSDVTQISAAPTGG